MARLKLGWFVGALPLLAVGGLAGRYMGHSDAPAQAATTTSAAASADLETLQRRLVALEGQARRSQLQAQANLKQHESELAAGEEEPASGAKVTEPASPDQQNRRYWSQVESAFESETPDQAWNPEGNINSDFARALPNGARINAVECRTSMCRVEMQHPDLDSYNKFVLSSFVPPASLNAGEEFRPLWRGMTMFKVASPEPGKPLLATSYLVRENYSLPSLEGESASAL